MPSPTAPRLPVFWLAAVLLAMGPATGSGQEEEPETLVPGLVVEAEHPQVPDVKATTIVANPSWNWRDGSPDLRLPADRFRVLARGVILIQEAGSHRFFGRTDGEARLWLGEREVRLGKETVSPESVILNPGFTKFRLEYQHETGPARLAIDWEGPTFSREPLPARLLSHVPEQAPPVDLFEQGRRLADRLGCANCHAIPGIVRHPGLGPPLGNPAAMTQPGWLEGWLRDPSTVRPDSPMPRYGPGLSDGEINDLLAFLGKSGPRLGLSDEVKMALNLGSTEKGRLLFRSVGCLGCHARSDAPGMTNLAARSAPDLTHLGGKRSAAQIAAWLEHPKLEKKFASSSRHRPDLHLTAEESAHLGVYLATQTEEAQDSQDQLAGAGEAGRGRQLLDRLRCASCHEVDDLEAPKSDVPIAPGRLGARGCLSVEPTGPSHPQFALTDAERLALVSFLDGLPAVPALLGPQSRAEDVIRRRNCLGCHSRDSRGGEELAGRLAPLLGEDRDLAALKGRLSPPNLSAVGDKLLPEYLQEAIEGKAPSARPWLTVRMPSFAFEPGEAESLARLFQDKDRISTEVVAKHGLEGGRPALEVGARLIGQKGFGCLSCHVVAGRIPPGGEPETLGPDLALAHRRMTERYFRRWISDPQRVILGTPMPQFLKAVEGSGLPSSLDDQLTAVWSLIRSPDLGQAVAFGTRDVLRQEGERAAVVRDMVLIPGAPETPYTPRGLAIGLNNGASLLFDTDRLTWLAWWRGGFLSRTKAGRLWEWHPEGRSLWVAPQRLPSIALGQLPDGSPRLPDEVRGRFGGFKAVEFQGKGVRLEYSLHSGEEGTIAVVETIQPAGTGWERRIEVTGIGEGVHPELLEQPPARSSGSGEGSVEEWVEGTDRVRLSVDSGPRRSPTASGGTIGLWSLKSLGNGRFEARTRVQFSEP